MLGTALSAGMELSGGSAFASARLRPSGALGLLGAGSGSPHCVMGGTGAEARGPSAAVAGWCIGEEARPAAFCCDLHTQANENDGCVTCIHVPMMSLSAETLHTHMPLQLQIAISCCAGAIQAMHDHMRNVIVPAFSRSGGCA